MFHDWQAGNYLILLFLHLMDSSLQLEEDNLTSLRLIIEATLLMLEYVVPTTWVPISTITLAAISWFDSIVIF